MGSVRSVRSVAECMENMMILRYQKIGYLAVMARNTNFRAVKQIACSMTMIFLHEQIVYRPIVSFCQLKIFFN